MTSTAVTNKVRFPRSSVVTLQASRFRQDRCNHENPRHHRSQQPPCGHGCVRACHGDPALRPRRSLDTSGRRARVSRILPTLSPEARHSARMRAFLFLFFHFGGASCKRSSKKARPFEVTSKRRKGFPSETQVKRGLRIVGGHKELVEKLGRNDPCPCGSTRRFKQCCMQSGCF